VHIKNQNTVQANVKTLKHNNTILRDKLKELKQSSLVQFTNKNLMQDIILNYPQISLRVKKEIILAVIKYSTKYNINPLIIYSMLHTESSMRYWIEHSPRYVIINKKLDQTYSTQP